MIKFELYITDDGRRNPQPIVCKSFKEAEKKAMEIFKGFEYQSNSYVECVLDKRDLWETHIAMMKDCFGDVYWRSLVYDDTTGIFLYDDLLSDYQQEELEEWRSIVERNIYDLQDDELEELYHKVVFGSCYLSDYVNDFNVDENKLSDACEAYLKWIEDGEIDDTPIEFVNFVKYY